VRTYSESVGALAWLAFVTMSLARFGHSPARVRVRVHWEAAPIELILM